MVSCPSVTDNGALSGTDFCVNQGEDPTLPTLIKLPTASNGQIVTTITETCSNIVTTTTGTITYGFSGLQHRDGTGPPTKGSPAGRYWANYYVTVSSSDTNNCAPSPAEIPYGTVSWTVASDAHEVVTVDVTALIDTLKRFLKKVTDVTEVVGSPCDPKIGLTSITAYRKQECCSAVNGPYMKSYVEGDLSLGWGCDDPGIPIPDCAILVPGGYASAGLFVTLDFTGKVIPHIGIAQPCVTEPICFSFSVDGSIGLKAGVFISLPSNLAGCNISASGTASASISSACNGDGSGTISGNVGKLEADVTLELKAIHGVFCKSYKKTWDLWDGIPIAPFNGGCFCL